MKYQCALIAVRNMEESKRFYREVLGQKIGMDMGANVTFRGGFALQTAESWAELIGKQEKEICFGGNDAELYFEEDDLDGFLVRLEACGVKYVHRAKEHPWGQRVVRFYDPDLHIVEVGENMDLVVKRFFAAGMTVGEVAERTGLPEAAVERIRKK